MNQKYVHLAGFVLIMAFLSACNQKEEVPTDTVDQNQTITRENSQLNAQRYSASVYPEATQVIMQSDSTVSKNCRFGDGWASGVVVKNGNTIAKIKCQTNGSGKGTYGCMKDDEFKTKDYASQDGHCDQSIIKLDKFK